MLSVRTLVPLFRLCGRIDMAKWRGKGREKFPVINFSLRIIRRTRSQPAGTDDSPRNFQFLYLSREDERKVAKFVGHNWCLVKGSGRMRESGRKLRVYEGGIGWNHRGKVSTELRAGEINRGQIASVTFRTAHGERMEIPCSEINKWHVSRFIPSSPFPAVGSYLPQAWYSW